MIFQVTVMMKDGTLHNNLIFLDEGWWKTTRLSKSSWSSGPEEFLEALKRFVSVKRSSSDVSLFVLMDPRYPYHHVPHDDLDYFEIMRMYWICWHTFWSDHLEGIQDSCLGSESLWVKPGGYPWGQVSPPHPVLNCSLLITRCPLLITRCSLLVTHSPLLIAH